MNILYFVYFKQKQKKKRVIYTRKRPSTVLVVRSRMFSMAEKRDSTSNFSSALVEYLILVKISSCKIRSAGNFRSPVLSLAMFCYTKQRWLLEALWLKAQVWGKTRVVYIVAASLPATSLYIAIIEKQNGALFPYLSLRSKY